MWYEIANVDEIASPALLVYPARVDENVRRMIALAGGTRRLRPHVKTNKMAEVIRRQLAVGIDKFKCATIAEAEMLAETGAPDVLLAYQPVGPNANRLARLAASFLGTRFSTIADDAGAIRRLAAACTAAGVEIEVLLDLDVGMHRSGVAPGPQAIELYRLLADSPGLAPGGLHVYDGHIRAADAEERARQTAAALAPVDALREELAAARLPVPRVVAGGTPTFPMHARREDLECSPGTCVFWDHSYATKFPDLDFVNAALVLTRVVSKPVEGRLCLDLGYKAVSPDNPDPRVSSPICRTPGWSCTAKSTWRSRRREHANTPWATCCTACRFMSARPSRCTKKRWWSRTAARWIGGKWRARSEAEDLNAVAGGQGSGGSGQGSELVSQSICLCAVCHAFTTRQRRVSMPRFHRSAACLPGLAPVKAWRPYGDSPLTRN